MSDHPMHWKNQPRWRRPDEVTEPGLYVFIRTDDEVVVPGTIALVESEGHIIDPLMRGFEANSCIRIMNWDPECRFFGPIPKREE